jgi:acyl-CoA thioesterase FadM
MTGEYTRRFQVRWSEVGPANRVPASKHVEYLIETAYDWSTASCIDFEAWEALGIIWIIHETDIRFLHPLRYLDEFDFTIWLIEWRKFRGKRAFELRLKDSDTIIATGTQMIVSLDSQSLRPKVVPDEIMEKFEMQNPRVFDFDRIQKQKQYPQGSFRMQKRVEWGDLDSLVHLNNGVALKYADEILMQFLHSLGWPPEVLFEKGMMSVPKRIHIQYQEPGLWSDELEMITYPTVVNSMEACNTILIERPKDGKVILQAYYSWGLVDLKTDREEPLPLAMHDSLSALITISPGG